MLLVEQQGCVQGRTGAAYPNLSPTYFCLSPSQLVPVGVDLIAIFLPPPLWLCVRAHVALGNNYGCSRKLHFAK